MNTNKLPNLGSTGWGKSLNDYIKGIETRVSDIEHGLNEITIEGISWDISSGVVGFNGRMMRVASGSDLNPDERVIDDGQEITSYRNPNQFFWKGEVFFKDIGNGTSVYKTIDDDGEAYWDIKADPDTGWTPVYLKIGEFGEGLSYLKDNENAYLTHPFVILLGFIFYDGEKIYWHYKTSKSDESTYAKRFMLTRPLAKFNSTFDVKSNGGRSYTITGKQTGNKNPILTLNAMGINYYDSNLTDESLKKGPDYKEFEISTDTPVISYISGSSVYYTNSTFTTPNTLNKRYIHRVFFSNAGRYVLQSEQYDSDKGTDFSTVVSYGFDNIYPNFERYGDLVEIFRFVTEGTESSNNLVKVYQVIGSGIPPVDSFGVVPEVNYVSKEGSNNIQFTDSNNNYFTLVGQNYSNSPKKVYFNFRSELDEEGYNVLFNDTLFDGYLGSINFRDAGSDTNYSFTPDNLSLELSSSRYIKMGNVGGFQGIELKNDNSIISMNNDGLGLRNGESSIVLDDSTQNINLNAASDISLSGNNVTVNSSEKFELSSGNVTKIQGDDSGLAIETSLDSRARGKITVNPSTVDIDAGSTTYGNNRIRLTSSNLKFSKDDVDYLTVSNTGVLSSYSLSESGSSNLNWEIGKDQAEFPALKVGTDNYRLVFLEDVDLVTTRESPHDNLPGANLYWKVYRLDDEDTGERYLLNNFPVLGQNVFKLRIRWDDVEHNAYWSGNFPVQFYTVEGGHRVARSLVVVDHFGWVTSAIYTPSTGELTGELSVAVKLDRFTGWAWEVIF